MTFQKEAIALEGTRFLNKDHIHSISIVNNLEPDLANACSLEEGSPRNILVFYNYLLGGRVECYNSRNADETLLIQEITKWFTYTYFSFFPAPAFGPNNALQALCACYECGSYWCLHL